MLEDWIYFSQYFNTLFSPLKFQIQTPCPDALLIETEHDLQQTVFFL